MNSMSVTGIVFFVALLTSQPASSEIWKWHEGLAWEAGQADNLDIRIDCARGEYQAANTVNIPN